MDVGTNIKQARAKAKMTQKALAVKIGKGTSTVQKYELGLATPPIDILMDIAHALNVPITDLFGPYEGSPLPGLVDGDKLDEVEPVHVLLTAKQRVDASFAAMNDIGRRAYAERGEEMAQLPKYQRQPEEDLAAPEDPD